MQFPNDRLPRNVRALLESTAGTREAILDGVKTAIRAGLRNGAAIDIPLVSKTVPATAGVAESGMSPAPWGS